MTPRKPDEGDPPTLTEKDIEWIHEQIRLDEHAKWLRGQVRVIWPWVVSVVGALVAAIIWIKEHVRF